MIRRSVAEGMLPAAVMTMRGRMGPGGLRGLQILRSGVHRVRGGFDSHAFPPLCAWTFALILGGAAGLVPAARAQGLDTLATIPGDSAIYVVDSSRVVRGVPTVRRVVPAKKPSRFSAPRWVMLRSLVVPGWGQAHNGAWYKAVAVAGAEAFLAVRVLDDQRELDRLAADVDAARKEGDLDLEEEAVNAYNSKLDVAFARQYLLGVVVVYALVDAYVDAHFKSFKVDFDTDPALPEGVPDEVGVRVGWEWKF